MRAERRSPGERAGVCAFVVTLFAVFCPSCAALPGYSGAHERSRAISSRCQVDATQKRCVTQVWRYRNRGGDDNDKHVWLLMTVRVLGATQAQRERCAWRPRTESRS